MIVVSGTVYGMANYDVRWVGSPEIQPQDLDKACKQVYVWLITNDRRVVIVSKDGELWQLPGGKPEPGETLTETAVREVREETNVDISSQAKGLRFFGYQIVKETGSEKPPYLQVRYLLELGAESPTLHLSAQQENHRQAAEDLIRFVGTASLDELAERIPWLEGSPEFTTVKSAVAA